MSVKRFEPPRRRDPAALIIAAVDLINTLAGLSAHQEGIRRIQANKIFNFSFDPFSIRTR